jgi:hypothetical protein
MLIPNSSRCRHWSVTDRLLGRDSSLLLPGLASEGVSKMRENKPTGSGLCLAVALSLSSCDSVSVVMYIRKEQDMYIHYTTASVQWSSHGSWSYRLTTA